MTQATRNRRVLAALLLLSAGVATSADALPSSPPGLPVPPATGLVQRAQATTSTEAAYILGIQKELLAHGYKAGPVDGVAGPRTRAAIREYQSDAGLTADGRATKQLLDHLKFVLPKVYRFGEPVVGVVLDVQRELAKRGYYLSPHDGIAGPATRRAVRWFQTDADLPRDETINSKLLQQIRDAPADIVAATSF